MYCMLVASETKIQYMEHVGYVQSTQNADIQPEEHAMLHPVLHCMPIPQVPQVVRPITIVII